MRAAAQEFAVVLGRLLFCELLRDREQAVLQG